MARVLFVHTDSAFMEQVTACLSEAGHIVSCRSNPMEALDFLESDAPCDVLLTRIDFGRGALNGIALARMARIKRQSIKVVFTGRPDFQKLADGLGEYLAAPVNVAELVAKISSLEADRRESTSRGRRQTRRISVGTSS